MALQTIIDKLQKHRDTKHPTLVIYLDLSKAYDTVSHEKLIHKLKYNFNFDHDTITFISTYFKNRIQTTHTEYATSSKQIITHGIPQGSTLSTTFFILYINDIQTTSTHSNIYTFADDTTLIIKAPDINILQKYAQHDLTSLITYLHANNLVPNETKTTYTIFYPRSYPTIKLTFNNTTLKQEATTKLLGVIIQNNLKFHQNTINVRKKLQPHIQTLQHINKFLPTQTMKQQYYSLIYPHIIYAITIWGHQHPSKQYLKPLHTIQKKNNPTHIQQTPKNTHTTTYAKTQHPKHL
jgi:hypothetical protein